MSAEKNKPKQDSVVKNCLECGFEINGSDHRHSRCNKQPIAVSGGETDRLFKHSDIPSLFKNILVGKSDNFESKYIVNGHKGYLGEITFFNNTNDVRFYVDNYPRQKKYYASNIKYETVDDFMHDMRRVGLLMELPDTQPTPTVDVEQLAENFTKSELNYAPSMYDGEIETAYITGYNTRSAQQVDAVGVIEGKLFAAFIKSLVDSGAYTISQLKEKDTETMGDAYNYWVNSLYDYDMPNQPNLILK